MPHHKPAPEQAATIASHIFRLYMLATGMNTIFSLIFGWPVWPLVAPFYAVTIVSSIFWTVALAAGLAVLTVKLTMAFDRPWMLFARAVMAIGVFLAGALCFSEIWCRYRMAADAADAGAECFASRSFVSSIEIASQRSFVFRDWGSDVHAVYIVGDHVFHWNYREAAFAEIPVSIFKNLDLLGCQRHFSADKIDTLMKQYESKRRPPSMDWQP